MTNARYDLLVGGKPLCSGSMRKISEIYDILLKYQGMMCQVVPAENVSDIEQIPINVSVIMKRS